MPQLIIDQAVAPSAPSTGTSVIYVKADGLAYLKTDSGVEYILSGLSADTDGTLAANSDALIPTQKAVKTFVSSAVTGLLDLKGDTDCSANPNYPAANKGDAYYVTAAGKIGGASGTPVDIGDVYYARADNAGGTEASVGASWAHLEHNLLGALLAANNLSDLASATTALTNLGLTANAKSLVTAATYAAMKILLSLDNVTNDAQTKATIVPNTAPAAGNLLIGNAGGTAYASTALSGDVTVTSTGVTAIGASKVTEAMQVLANNTTNDVSITKHGYTPILPNDSTKYLNGVGGYTVPPAGTPAGGAGQINYYNSGAFGANSNATINNSTGKMSLAAGLDMGTSQSITGSSDLRIDLSANTNYSIRFIGSGGSTSMSVLAGGSDVVALGGIGLSIQNGAGYAFSNSGSAGSNSDTSFLYSAATTAKLCGNNRSSYGDLELRGLSFALKKTVGTLPSVAASDGKIYRVSDSLAPAVGSAVSAGGSATCTVQSNASAWNVIWI